MPATGGEATCADTEPGEASEPRWSPDGRYLAYLLQDPETEDEKKRKEERDDVNVAEERHKYARLRVLDVQGGGGTTITPEKRHVIGFDWSPDAERLVAGLTETPTEDEWFLTTSVEIVPCAGGDSRQLLEVRGPVQCLRWSPDGAHIAYLGIAGHNVEEPGAVMVAPADGGKPRDLTAGYIGSATGLSWAPDGNVLFSAFEDVYGAINRLSLDGVLTPLLPEALRGRGSLTPPVSWSQDGGRYATIRTSANELEDVWAGELGECFGRLTHSNPELEASIQTRVERVCWTAADGMEIRGLLMYPQDYEEGKRYPFVVQPHGGPAWLWSDRATANWHDWGAYLAANGYAVLLPNPRGSTGRGAEFTGANYDDIGGGEFTDIMAGVDHVVELGIADPERMGIGGWSWGGYLTAWSITQTDRFKAAIMGAGLCNLLSDQGTGDIPHANDYLFSRSAYDDPLNFLQRSAIYHVKKVTTPVLILHGEADERVSVAQGREFYTALKYLGKEVQLVTYPRQGHSIKERKHQLDLIGRVLDWFDTHLKR